MAKKYILILFIVVVPFLTNAQTLTGTTGLLNIPSADMQADGTFIMGANYLPEINQPAWGYNTGNYYFNLTFLPFFEIAYKCTLIKRENTGHYTGQDRGISLRLQLMKEKKYLPAITFGAHDIYTSSDKGNQNFGTIYIVFTKHFNISPNILGITFGYGTDVLRHNQFVGLFGGLTLTPAFFKLLTLMAEYDCKGINLGGSLFLFNHLYLFSMAQHLEYFAGGVAYRIYL
ncbi:MAG: YjbH domain-containing protein [Bacteroidales bacterium]|jgi:hypothetical protein|nr:YjbH domain-containing protein [Bacteroidales bacterium]